MKPYVTSIQILALVVCLGMTVSIGSRLDSRADALSGQPQAQDPNKLPFLRPPTLTSLKTPYRQVLTGTHSGLYDDWLNFELLARISDRASSPNELDLKRQYLLQITRQEPETESTYTLACYHLAFEEEHGEDCRPISEYGLKVLGNNVAILMMRGYVEVLVLEDIASARGYFQRAAGVNNPPAVASDVLKSLEDGTFWADGPFSATIAWLDHSAGGDLLKEYMQENRDEAIAAQAEEEEPLDEPTDQAEDSDDTK